MGSIPMGNQFYSPLAINGHVALLDWSMCHVVIYAMSLYGYSTLASIHLPCHRMNAMSSVRMTRGPFLMVHMGA